jgi:hypothetical protein
MNSGQGYYVYVSSDGSISASQSIGKQALASNTSQELIYYKDLVSKQKYMPMNIFFTDLLDEKIEEIAAYNDNGLLIGAGKVIESSETNSRYAELIVSSDNPQTQNIDGFTDNENINFKAWYGGKEIQIYPSINGKGKITFEKMGTLFLKINADSFNKNSLDKFVLFSNYPNPFNPSTVLEFNLPEEDIVSLTIYNSLGEVVDKLIDKEVKAGGKYKISWNAKDRSSGIYFYQLQTTNKLFVNKMILMK